MHPLGVGVFGENLCTPKMCKYAVSNWSGVPCQQNEGKFTKEKRKKEGIIPQKALICAKQNFQVCKQHVLFLNSLKTGPTNCCPVLSRAIWKATHSLLICGSYELPSRAVCFAGLFSSLLHGPVGVLWFQSAVFTPPYLHIESR